MPIISSPVPKDVTAAVDSVFTRTGTVVAANGDYNGVVASALTGAVAATRYVGATADLAPVTGTFAVGDFVVAQSGRVWICTVAGSPGTWFEAGSDLVARAGAVDADNVFRVFDRFGGTPLRVIASGQTLIVTAVVTNLQSVAITSGALPTTALSSGVGHQMSTVRDVHTVTPVTFTPTAGATATCAVALSPDNVTYSALGTETEPVGVTFDGTIHLVSVFVPANWFIRLTVTNAAIGTTSYY